MKKVFLLGTILLAAGTLVNAQAKDYKVVFDITSRDTVDYKAVVRQATGIAKSNPGARLEVVIYGEALNMVVKDKSIATVSDGIQDLTKNKQVSFKVCAVTMKRHNIDASMLTPGVEIVPDGIYEIVTKQKEGYGYIKVGH